MNKQKKIIIGVLALLVTMMVGYALFSETITINGTATAKGEFNMEITSASITNEVGSTGATAEISDNGNTLIITVPHLEYPGAYVDVSFNITNNGSIPALYKGINVIGIDKTFTRNSTNAIRLSGTIDDFYYEPSDTYSETVRIFWKGAINKTEEESATAIITLNYIQVNDKEDACAKATELVDQVASCTASSSSCTNYDNMDFDLNGLINVSDTSFVKSKAKEKLCAEIATTN